VTDKELDKNAARRLAIIRRAREVSGNVALTCRYYGISRQVFYSWLRRYQAEGLARACGIGRVRNGSDRGRLRPLLDEAP
jgi:transposase-like protein